MAVVLGWWTAVAALRLVDANFILPGIALPTMVALAILASIGVLDDVFRLRARWKMMGQAIAVFPIVMAGCQLRLVELGGYSFDLGMLSIPATVFWLVLGINALNLLDGMDGMATVISTGIALTLTAVFATGGQQSLAVLIFPLAGSLLGFLAYNFPPARIYMGDAGSMVLGLALSLASLLAAKVDGPATNLTMLVAIMAIPLADTALAIVRRSLSGFGFWHPDRAHIHHRLLDQGLPARQVLAIFASLGAAWASSSWRRPPGTSSGRSGAAWPRPEFFRSISTSPGSTNGPCSPGGSASGGWSILLCPPRPSCWPCPPTPSGKACCGGCAGCRSCR